jgi:hypothetical protein
MAKFRIGDVVRQKGVGEGTVTEVRPEEYGFFVRWDNHPELNDWYLETGLEMARGTVEDSGSAVMTMSGIELADGAIGISNSHESLSNTPNVERDTQFPFGK